MAKLAFIDVETTGLYAPKHGVWSCSGYLFDDGRLLEGFDYKMNPGPVEYSQHCLDEGYTPEFFSHFESSEAVLGMFMTVLGKYINLKIRQDRFILVAYNARFDCDHLVSWFDRHQKLYWKYFFSGHICVMSQAMSILQNKRHLLPDFKLTTLAKYLDIPLENAHQSKDDIVATIHIYDKLKPYFNTL